jgi:hypothetical protein
MPSYSGVFTLQAQMQAIAANNWPSPPPTTIGQPFGGGFYAGAISTAGNSVADYYLVVAPLASGQSSLQWKNAGTATPGADSFVNGTQNTADMVADGNATVYPAAHFCNDLSTGGQTDWYMPARNELEICYFNLKPTTQVNTVVGTGTNPNAVPARASPYTSGNPPQTSATAFQSGGSEAFSAVIYWTSTETTNPDCFSQSFSYGLQANNGNRQQSYRVRAIRRVAV